MGKFFVITGHQHSGWHRISDVLIGRDQKDAVLNNAVTKLRFDRGQSFPEGSAKKALTTLEYNGWADGKSYTYLDEWSRLGEMCAVLVYSSPESVFSEALSDSGGDLKAANEVMASWKNSAQKMLNYFQSHRSTTLLVHVDSIVERNDELKALFQKITGWAPCDEEVVHSRDKDAVIEAQATQLIDGYEIQHSLYENLQSAASLPGPDIAIAGFASDRARKLTELALSNYIIANETSSQPSSENDTNNASLNGQLTRLEALEEEKELSILQIFQLQEELEHYYLKYEELKQQSVLQCLTLPRAAEHSLVSGCEIMGVYAEDGYEDISLLLSQLKLADGRQFENLRCKLVKKAGALGIEVREKDTFSELMTWPAGMSDDHGRFFLYLPAPHNGHKIEQQALRDHLSTKDRQLIEGIINALADSFIAGRLGNLELYPELPLRHWRLAAAELTRLTSAERKFFSLDKLKIIEDYSAGEYKHLWLECLQVQVDKRVIKQFDFKLGAITTEKKGAHFDQLVLEFREQIGGEIPLEAWPPTNGDEYGPKMLLSLDARGSKTYVDLAEHLTQHDEEFIVSLIKKLPILLAQLEKQDETVAQHWVDNRSRLVGISTSEIRFGAKLNLLNKAKHGIKRAYTG